MALDWRDELLHVGENVRHEFWHWRMTGGSRDNFHSMLFALIAKADMMNRCRIAKGFPEEVAIWKAWCTAPDQEDFWAALGMKVVS